MREAIVIILVLTLKIIDFCPRFSALGDTGQDTVVRSKFRWNLGSPLGMQSSHYGSGDWLATVRPAEFGRLSAIPSFMRRDEPRDKSCALHFCISAFIFERPYLKERRHFPTSKHK